MSSLKSLLSSRVSLGRYAEVLTIYNLVAFNIPFLLYVIRNVDFTKFSGTVIVVSMVLLLLALNYFAIYLSVYLLRLVGKIFVAIANFISSACVYFIIVYKTMMDESMVGNFFNTQASEAAPFLNFKLFAFVTLLGLIPSVLIVLRMLDYGSFKTFGYRILCSLGISLGLVLVNMNNFLWIGEHDTELGGLIMPWSYTANTVLLFEHKRDAAKDELPLPDAVFKNSDKAVCVLVIGESARVQNFSVYGEYEKRTNPLLEKRDDIVLFDAHSNATYTTAGVRAIVEYAQTSELCEILPNYLYRTGADVIWRTSNWGEPPVHIAEYEKMGDIKKRYAISGESYDEYLLCGLRERILESKSDKMLVVLHTSTSHGPKYSTRYPARFGVFSPVSDSVEEAASNPDALYNAYDNTIVYTDYLLDSIIGMLSALDDRKSSMIFVSDHGESLGENNLYMHGVPLKIAPPQQYEIPFIVWTSDNRKCRSFDSAIDQHFVFHSVLDLLDVDSPVFDRDKDVFE